MFKAKKSKGFTLIEILITITIIGILAAVILAMISSSKDNAKKKSAYSEVRAVQAALLQCVINESRAVYCNGDVGVLNSSSECGYGFGKSKPIVGTSICGIVGSSPDNRSNIAWPDISKYKYAYSGVAGSFVASGAFAVAIGKDADNDGKIDVGEAKVFCCTQNGCSEITDGGGGLGNYGCVCRHKAGIYTGVCDS